MFTIEESPKTSVVRVAEEALIREARRHARIQRAKRLTIFMVLIGAVVALLIQFGGFSPGDANTKLSKIGPAAALPACTKATLKLISASSVPGAAVTAGILFNLVVESPQACSLAGFPLVKATVAGQGLATTAHQLLSGLLGGLPPTATSASRAPTISIQGQPKRISFVVEYWTGNGNQCPKMTSLEFSIPGSVGQIRVPVDGDLCGSLTNTPIVSGSTGRVA